MEDKKNILDVLGSTLKKYQEKILKLNEDLTSDNSDNKFAHLSKVENIQRLSQKAEEAYEKLKESSDENWQAAKDSSLKIFTELEKGFSEFTKTPLIEATDEIFEYSQNMLEELQKYVKENPLSATLWALIGGFILGKIIRLHK